MTTDSCPALDRACVMAKIPRSDSSCFNDDDKCMTFIGVLKSPIGRWRVLWL
ncbi:hypothetical protein [Moraxella lacunata]|uniref:hypothetical protein n=1 Tax=Moraxella lacunata TaxID=477 RepID=UPI003EDEB623